MGIQLSSTVYSFRAYTSVLSDLYQQAPADITLVAAIEAAVLQANTAFAGRDYQAAITAYLSAQSLMYSQIDSQSVHGVTSHIADLPRSVELFDPFLSASLEWMNVLPVQAPVSPVRPQVAVPSSALKSMAAREGTGLISSTLGTDSAMQAAADLHLADTLTTLGNDDAAAFYLKRAKSTDASAVDVLAAAVPTADPASGAAATHVTAHNAVTGHPLGQNLASAQNLASGKNLFSGQTVLSGQAFATNTLLSAGLLGRSSDVSSVFASGISPIVTLPPAATVTRSLGIFANDEVSQVEWAAGASPALADAKKIAYQSRVTASLLTDAISKPAVASDFILGLPHLYFFQVPLGLAESYQALGDWTAALKFYLIAADYAYLNAAVEVPYVWLQLASLYLDWGDALYESGDPAAALAVYEKVLATDGSVPTAAPLYSTAALADAAAVGKTVIAGLAALIDGSKTAADLGADPQVCAIIIAVHQHLVTIAAGLDFWGNWSTQVPIWTFAYLQQVAVTFTQYAISAEQQVISFWDRAAQGQLTQLQLSQQVSQAYGEVNAAAAQLQAAQAEVTVYQAGAALAELRATDAAANASEYQSTSSAAIVHQALQSQLGGGDDGNAGDLNALANTMITGGYSLSGSGATLAAAEQLTAARLSQSYEVDSLNRTAAELSAAQAQAQTQVAAAGAQATAAAAALAVAQLKASGAQAMAAAFSAQTFTPDVWQAMGDEMLALSKRYFANALKVAKLMQQAYNFETDQQLATIKASYASDEIKGLLGADALMADIQDFTYNLITSTKSKVQPIKQTISLAQQYGWDFETQLRKTGSMTFETRISDFDNRFPGTYAGRIKSVSVDVIGLVPSNGLSGTLTNSGLSWYRLPADSWPVDESTGLKARVQTSETLVLSDYSTSSDGLLLAPDDRIGGIFDGAGVASSWVLNLPKEVNDLDYGALLDVTITFVYEARFDPSLATRVLSQLAALPGATERVRGIPIRWLYPDLFYSFAQTGTLDLTLTASDFPTSQTDPVVTSIGLQVTTLAPLAASGLTFALSTPGHPAARKLTTDADGAASSTSSGSAWSILAKGTALGDYSIALTAADNPALVTDGQLDLSHIENLALVLGYSFTAHS